MRRTGPDAATREMVEGRALWACERCGFTVSRTSCQIHHRKPRGSGGSSNPAINYPSNLLLLCNECHTWVERNRTTSYEQGWLVRREHDPVKSPVWLPGRGFCFLTEIGDIEEID